MKKLIYFLSVYFVIFIMFIILLNINGKVIAENNILYYPFGITMLFWYVTFFVYVFQIILAIVGMLFHFIKEKQSIKNLLVPYGFIFTLKNYYKELK